MYCPMQFYTSKISEFVNLVPTVVLVPDSSGEVPVMRKVVIELQNDPLSVLDFSDFSLGALLRNGVQPKSIMISKDLRLGHDSDFSAFESKIESMYDQIFVTSKID